ncbi:MAG: hypothetical protein GY754_20755 [bacterium]|nr:hypothetical protein [bacterium]
MSEKEFIPPCEECGGTCCKYIAIEIDKPTTKTDYDHIRWYLLHKDVNVFVDHDKKWYVEFRTPCESQTKKNQCGIYTTRPKICRGHGNTEYECEFYDSPFSIYFSKVDEFEKYLSKKKIDWKFKKL